MPDITKLEVSKTKRKHYHRHIHNAYNCFMVIIQVV